MRFKRFGGRRRGNVGFRPSRVWADVSTQFVLNSVTATSATTLINLEAPANLSALTSDPPEDLTLLRIVGNFSCSLSGAASGTWTLALLVQDAVWTPGATFTVDADKRILWSRTFRTQSVATSWFPPGYQLWDLVGTIQAVSARGITDIDIKPMVKMEAGKSLYLVGYEDSNGQTLLVTSTNMRVLYQRSGRRH